MLPNNLETWVYLLVACFIGFVIGQWIKTRRDKVKTNSESADGLKRRALADTHVQTKKDKKKNRRINQKNSGL